MKRKTNDNSSNDDRTSKKSKTMTNKSLAINVSEEQDVDTLKTHLKEIEMVQSYIHDLIQIKENLCEECNEPMLEKTIRCNYRGTCNNNNPQCQFVCNTIDDYSKSTNYCDNCMKHMSFQCENCESYYCHTHNFKMVIQTDIKITMIVCTYCYEKCLHCDIDGIYPSNVKYTRLYPLLKNLRDLVVILHERIGLTSNMIHHILLTEKDDQIDSSSCTPGWKIVQNDATDQ